MSLSAPKSPLDVLIELQTFEGYWEATNQLATAIGMSLDQVRQQAKTMGHEKDPQVVATALAISYFESKLQKDKNTWELIVEKAKSWLATKLGGEDKADELLAKAAALL